MIAIIDYGLGNIKAFANIYKRLKLPYLTANRPADLDQASKIILPGVGSFDQALKLLDQSGMKPGLLDHALNKKTPILGICIGMHILGNSSEEGKLEGLGLIAGQVKQLDAKSHEVALPHMGWNQVKSAEAGAQLFEGIEQGAEFYFLHSYYFAPASTADAIANFQYAGKNVCGIRHENIYGIQFHPEKSHSNGERLLANFGSLKC